MCRVSCVRARVSRGSRGSHIASPLMFLILALVLLSPLASSPTYFLLSPCDHSSLPPAAPRADWDTAAKSHVNSLPCNAR